MQSSLVFQGGYSCQALELFNQFNGPSLNSFKRNKLSSKVWGLSGTGIFQVWANELGVEGSEDRWRPAFEHFVPLDRAECQFRLRDCASDLVF
jgi:hypothetical protein